MCLLEVVMGIVLKVVYVDKFVGMIEFGLDSKFVFK